MREEAVDNVDGSKGAVVAYDPQMVVDDTCTENLPLHSPDSLEKDDAEVVVDTGMYPESGGNEQEALEEHGHRDGVAWSWAVLPRVLTSLADMDLLATQVFLRLSEASFPWTASFALDPKQPELVSEARRKHKNGADAEILSFITQICEDKSISHILTSFPCC